MIDLHDPKVLAALNSATKYPSIVTFHALGEKGRLTESYTLPWWEEPGEVVYTEKVDGTNVRIIVLPDHTWLIGSREELLTAKGDIVHNPAMGIVNAIRPTARYVAHSVHDEQPSYDGIQVIYGELYGNKIGAAAKHYTKGGQNAFRLFDIAYIPFEKLEMSPEAISTWREGSGQRFATEATLQRASEALEIPLTPRLGTDSVYDVPSSHQGVMDLMRSMLPTTRVGLDVTGESEGVVLRTKDRRFIAKARFQDYARTLRAAK
jgi:hypothetical protein